MTSFALACSFETASARACAALVASRAWTRANAADIDLEGGLITAHLVMIAMDSNISARSNGFDKDTSASSLVDALKDAVNLFKIDISFNRLNSSTLQASGSNGPGRRRALFACGQGGHAALGPSSTQKTSLCAQSTRSRAARRLRPQPWVARQGLSRRRFSRAAFG